VFQDTKLGAENPPFGGIYGQIEISSTHNLFCRKSAAVCLKIATFLSPNFLNPRRRCQDCTILWSCKRWCHV